jgi:histidinol-phosphatase (PHP family)
MGDHHLHLHPHEPAQGGPPPGSYPDGLIESYVEVAGRRGVDALGFTEHLYRCVESEAALGRWWEHEPDPRLAEHTRAFVMRDRNLRLETYVEAVEAAKDRGLPVALGLEVDFFPETIDAVLDLIAPYPWDFLIGSVHWIGGWAVDTAEVTGEFERRGVRRAWEEYFALETQLAASGSVDVLAHVDVCKKYGHKPEQEPVDLYRAVVDAASGSGTAVEVSSQGLRKPVDEVYPAPSFLEMFNRAGVPITLASDGHAPDEAAWGHEKVVAAARRAGYTRSLRFERRRRWEVPLR